MLKVESVHLHYGASHILRGIGLMAERGKITCVLGRNGVGKTSLMRAILGLQPVSGGRIAWDGQDVTGVPTHKRAGLGFASVPQGRDIFPRLTVEENLQTGFSVLPRGQQQQLAIARALIMRPKLLVLDEPTEGIQPSIIKDIERVIRSLARRGDMAIVLVEQYFEFARDLADYYGVMERGEMVLSGTRAEMNEADVRRRMAV
jgi:urea transport system ATP-binding protein